MCGKYLNHAHAATGTEQISATRSKTNALKKEIDMKPDVAEPIKLHSWSFERQTPGYCSNIRGEAHRPQHFGPENAAVADLNPLVQPFNVSEYFH